MVKSGNMVLCNPLLSKIVYEKLFSFFIFLFPRWASDQRSPKCSAGSKYLAHICQIKWNLLSFDDENDNVYFLI